MDFLSRNKEILKKGVVVGALAFAASKIYPLTQEDHSISNNTKSPLPLDKSIFPAYFVNKQGFWIHSRCWEVVNPVGMIFICHGFGEHIGRYDHVARFFNANGYSVYGIDHQGHGQSDGDRAYAPNIQFFINDFVHFVSTIKHGNLPRFLYGHSMGGLISSLLLTQHQDIFTGAIISGPLVVPDPKVATPMKIALAQTLSNWLPKLELDKLGVEGLSNSETVRIRYQEDRLNYSGGMKVRMAVGMMAGMAKLKQNMAKIITPMLNIHGALDPICSVEGTRILNANVSSMDKEIKIYEGMLHEPHNEPDHMMVLKDVVSWVSQRTP